MSHSFFSILRQPDRVSGATDASAYRFEEDLHLHCPVEYDYRVEGSTAKVTVYPSGSPIRFLKLRFRGDLSFVDAVCGDEWARSTGDTNPIQWCSMMAHRRLPWFCYLRAGAQIACYGVKTGPNCFAFWQADTHGLTLFLNLMAGSCGADLQEPLVACEIVERFSEEGESPYQAATAFAKCMCTNPVLPKEPVFGVNNWYWAYGNITHDSVIMETDYLLEMTRDTRHRPYMIIDDGWQFNRTLTTPAYIGGPWYGGTHFGDMARTAADIREKGAKPGIWFRPLLTLGRIPQEACLARDSGGQVMDPTHPYTLQRIQEDAARIHDWGFQLLKHDFTTQDLLGLGLMTADKHGIQFMAENRKLFDTTRPLAAVIKDIYWAIQNGMGSDPVIGCCTIGHLVAGIHAIQRVGGDTSGRSFEWTVRNGINSMMRLPQNDSFYRIDPDCAAFTGKVPAEINLDFLEMCALTGVTTLASVTPGILTKEQMSRIQEIYRMADRDESRYGIVNFEKTSLPEIFEEKGQRREFNWSSVYDGSRSQLNWIE